MSPFEIGIVGFVLVFVLIALGLPIGFSMGMVGCVGIGYLTSVGVAIAKMGLVPFDLITSYDFAVLPLFMFMAHVVFVSELGKDLYDLAAKWLGHLPGGLCLATIAACAGFAAVSASSLATAVTIGLIAIEQMKKYNYSPKLSTGCVAAGGTMGSMIPPSGTLIIYGLMTEQSIGRLFMAGIIPGLIEAVFYMIIVYILCHRNPALGPRGSSFNLREKVAAFASCGEIIALVFLVIGGILIGWFTPTEAGAVGAFGAILSSLFRRRLNWQKFKHAIMETMKGTGMIFGILIGAKLFNYFIAMSNLPTMMADFIGKLPIPPLGIIMVIVLAYLILGCLMDVIAMILLTLPVFYPIIIRLGFDPIWFGVIVTALGEIGAITPPVGVNVYAVAGIAPDVPMETIFKGIVPFFIADLCRLTLYILVPQVVLFLPNLIFG